MKFKLRKIARNALEKMGINSGIRHQIMDHNPFRRQAQLITKDIPTIFDVGAHEGGTIVRYKKYWKKCNIYSFEPSPANFDKLFRRFGNDSAIVIENTALSDCTGTVEFHINKSTYTNSILQTTDKEDHRLDFVKMEVVNAITIDEYCTKNGIEAIDILKIDVQGAELLVLEGAKQLLSKGGISLIYLEVCFKKQYQNQATFACIFSTLSKYGFQLINLYDISYSKNTEISYADAIFYKVPLVI